jgi:hypothetical protein
LFAVLAAVVAALGIRGVAQELSPSRPAVQGRVDSLHTGGWLEATSRYRIVIDGRPYAATAAAVAHLKPGDRVHADLSASARVVVHTRLIP